MSFYRYFWNIVSLVGATWESPKSTVDANVATAVVAPEPTSLLNIEKRDAWPPNYCGLVGGTFCRILFYQDIALYLGRSIY